MGFGDSVYDPAATQARQPTQEVNHRKDSAYCKHAYCMKMYFNSLHIKSANVPEWKRNNSKLVQYFDLKGSNLRIIAFEDKD